MIYESHYWKDALLGQAKALERKKTQRRWPEASFAKVEQLVMLGFYSIRKLVEAGKLTDALSKGQFGLTSYVWLGKTVHRMNRYEYWELYDIDHPQVVTRDLPYICNQVIHSYLFSFDFDETGTFDGVIVSSDRQRHERVYLLSIGWMVDIFREVGTNYPSKATSNFNPKKQDYDSVLE